MHTHCPPTSILAPSTTRGPGLLRICSGAPTGRSLVAATDSIAKADTREVMCETGSILSSQWDWYPPALDVFSSSFFLVGWLLTYYCLPNGDTNDLV